MLVHLLSVLSAVYLSIAEYDHIGVRRALAELIPEATQLASLYSIHAHQIDSRLA